MDRRDPRIEPQRGQKLLLLEVAALTRPPSSSTAFERLSAEIGEDLARLLVTGLLRHREPRRECAGVG
jgi:hypothetical protein